MIGQIKYIIRRKGFIGLWNGNIGNVYRKFPYAGLEWTLYDYFKRRLKRRADPGTSKRAR